MKRRSTDTILLSSFLAGMLPVALAVLTGTGTSGAYVFALVIIPVLLLTLMWPQRRRFFVRPPEASDPDERRIERGRGRPSHPRPL